MLIRLAGFIAVVSIIIAGVELIIAEGNTDKGVAARNRIINSVLGLAIVLVAATMVSFLGNALGGAHSSGQLLPNAAAEQGAINKILNIVFVTLGSLAFLYMVIAGFRIVASRGDTTKMADARRQIVYAALGLLVVASAAAIVNYILGRLG
jgi:membrane-associated protease RseP (regulator of RpoE activity)